VAHLKPHSRLLELVVLATTGPARDAAFNATQSADRRLTGNVDLRLRASNAHHAGDHGGTRQPALHATASGTPISRNVLRPDTM
jgi:hypothetical protein